MIAAYLGSIVPPDSLAEDFARLLQFGAGRITKSERVPRGLFSYCVPQKWLATRSPATSVGGLRVLFHGDFFNCRQIADQLGLAHQTPAAVYAAALEAWGNAVDDRVVGHYCAIALQSDGVLRLSRSPLYGPPLHFRVREEQVVASSTVRSLFWREEMPRELDLERLSRTLLLDYSDRFAGPYKGSHRLPLGCAIELSAGGFREVWRYDLFSRPPVRFKRDDDYVEAALALFDEGVAAALEGSERPAILISGGLDSTSVAASALRQLPEGQLLHGFTHDPEDAWEGEAPPGRYLREFPAVQRFAAEYPALRVERMTNPDRDFRYRHRELVMAMDQAVVGSAVSFEHLTAYEAARDKGCDLMLTGSMGNITISSDAEWAPVEYLVTGRWIQLWRALKHRRGAIRPIWQRLLSLSVLPLLPDPLWRLAMRMRPGHRPKREDGYCLSPGWMARHRLVERARDAGISTHRGTIRSRDYYWRLLLDQDNQEFDEMEQAYEQLFGIRTHDPTYYRPLVEFCYGLPTDQFLRDGVSRSLARRMAKGRLPEEIRLNANKGVNCDDWLSRLRRVRHELIEEIDRMVDDEDIAAVIDLPRLRRMLAEFPDKDQDVLDPRAYFLAIPLGISAGRFIAYAKGRNDL